MKTIIYWIEDLWFEIKMAWLLKHAVRLHGYSETFNKMGYWLDDTNSSNQ